MSDLINSINKVKALKNSKGIQYLLNAGSRILGNPIYIHDIDYRLIANTENIATDDYLWNELVTIGKHSEDSIDLFKNEYFIDAMANAKIITLLVSDKLKYDRIIGKVLSKNNVMAACAGIIACNKPFDEDDSIAFEILCKKLSKEISKSEFYSTYAEEHQEAVINKLIDGSIIDKKLYTRRVAEVYEGLKNYLYIAVADIGANKNKVTYFKNMFKQAQPKFKYSVYGDNVIIIFSSDDITLNVKKELKKLNKIIEENGICVGISNCFENLFELRKYYIEAFRALNYGLQSTESKRFFLYDEVSEDDSER